MSIKPANLEIQGDLTKGRKEGRTAFTGKGIEVGDNTAFNGTITISCYIDDNKQNLSENAWSYLNNKQDIATGDVVDFDLVCSSITDPKNIRSHTIEIE